MFNIITSEAIILGPTELISRTSNSQNNSNTIFTTTLAQEAWFLVRFFLIRTWPLTPIFGKYYSKDSFIPFKFVIFLSFKDKETIIHTFVTSKLDYCHLILSKCPNLSPRTNNSNAAAHLLARTGKRQHIKPVLASLHWLPVNSKIQFKILLINHSQDPSYSEEFTELHPPQRTLCSENSGILVTWSLEN